MKLNLSAGEVQELMARATFADLLLLAENFWDMPQQTRLLVLYGTSVDPFVLVNSFARFFWAFGFGDYFAEFTGVKDPAQHEKLARGKFEELVERMKSELRVVVSVVRSVERGGPLDVSFVKNVENMLFTTPISLPGYSDYTEVQRVVRAMAFEMAHPEFCCSIDGVGGWVENAPAFLGGVIEHEQVERGVAALSVSDTKVQPLDVLTSAAFGYCEGHGHGSFCCDATHS